MTELSLPLVAGEIGGIVDRRRELLTLLGSLFAALAIFMENVLQGRLPPTLKFLEGHVFAAYALMLLVPSLILALRLALLNGGMVRNGILYARLMREQDFVPRPSLKRAARLNPAGVSFLMFLLADLVAAFAAALLALTLQAPLPLCAAAGAGSFAACLAVFLWAHRGSGREAATTIREVRLLPPTRAQWQAHISASLQDSNHDMTGVLMLVGLVVFSTFQNITGLGAARAGADLPPAVLAEYGPAAYGWLMTMTCLAGMATYIRLRLAAGGFCLQLDPSDRPFRIFKITDSLLGYALIAFFFALGVHIMLFPKFGRRTLIAISAGAFMAALAAEQLAVARAARASGPGLKT